MSKIAWEGIIEDRFRRNFVNFISQYLYEEKMPEMYRLICSHYIPNHISCGLHNKCKGSKCTSFLALKCINLYQKNGRFYCKKRKKKTPIFASKCAQCFLQEMHIIIFDNRKRGKWFQAIHQWKSTGRALKSCFVCKNEDTCTKNQDPHFLKFYEQFVQKKSLSSLLSLECPRWELKDGEIMIESPFPYGFTSDPYTCPACNKAITHTEHNLRGCRIQCNKFYQWYHGKCFPTYLDELLPSKEVFKILL